MLDLETSARKFHFPESLNEKRLLVSLMQLTVGDDDGAVRVSARGQRGSGSPTQTDMPQMAQRDNAFHISEITLSTMLPDLEIS